MKIVFLFAAMLFFHETLFSQWTGNENPLTIKELKLTRLQQKNIRKVNADAATEIQLLKEEHNDNSEKIASGIAKINGSRIKKIRNCLTPEQDLVWRKKLMENKPHRGATGLPNE